MFDDIEEELATAAKMDNAGELEQFLDELSEEEFEENSHTLFDIATEAAEGAAFHAAPMLFSIPEVAKEGRERLLRYAEWDDTPDRLLKILATPMLPLDIILGTNENGMNALHLAMENKNLETVTALINANEFKRSLDAKDAMGRTAADIATEAGFKEGLALLGQDLGNDLSQGAIDPKLLSYLESTGTDPSRVLNNSGNCNGWAFLYQIYVTDDREDEFYDILEAIHAWDGNKETLDDTPLPESLQSKYINMRDLLEQVSNDLALFFYATNATEQLNLGWGQGSRLDQYELAKDPKVGRELANIFNYQDHNMSRDQLVEMLEFCARWPGSTVDIGGGEHATSLYITQDGEFKYYDPNMKQRREPFDSAEELADFIIASKYEKLNKINSDNTIDISLDLYQFLPANSLVPQAIEPTNPLNSLSANGFTPLHVAVLENDTNKVKALLTADPSLAMVKDANGTTPLHLAIVNNKKETLDALLATKGLDINMQNGSGDSPLLLAFSTRDPNLITALLKHPNLKMESDRDYVFKAASLGNPQILQVVLDAVKPGTKHLYESEGEMTALMDLAGRGNAEMVNMILSAKNFTTDINSQNQNTGMTALMFAIEKGHQDVVKALLEHGARLDIKNGVGKTAMDIARGKPEIMTLLKEHKQKAKADAPTKQEHRDQSKGRAVLFSQVHQREPRVAPVMASAVPEAAPPITPKKGPGVG